jgi:hypothetical protein
MNGVANEDTFFRLRFNIKLKIHISYEVRNLNEKNIKVYVE